MKPFSKSINWYPNNALDALKDEPETVAEVTPPAAMPADTPAQEVPNYPAQAPASEVEGVEMNIDHENIVEEGEE